MDRVRVVNTSRGRVLATRVCVADRWWQRLRGLLGTSSLPPGEGMLLHPCPSVHTFGMRYPLDVAFLDRSGTVLAVYPALAPNRLTRIHRGATFALELAAGSLGDTRPDDSLAWDGGSA